MNFGKAIGLYAMLTLAAAMPAALADDGDQAGGGFPSPSTIPSTVPASSYVTPAQIAEQRKVGLDGLVKTMQETHPAPEGVQQQTAATPNLVAGQYLVINKAKDGFTLVPRGAVFARGKNSLLTTGTMDTIKGLKYVDWSQMLKERAGEIVTLKGTFPQGGTNAQIPGSRTLRLDQGDIKVAIGTGCDVIVIEPDSGRPFPDFTPRSPGKL